jgi:dinuclear metal center YbgI/SA1388 family protein
LQEKWDCSGWIVETPSKKVAKIMLALTVTKAVVEQAKNNHCDMIISHHPLFEVPIEFKNIDIYCAHTNMDKTNGGTTDTLIENLFGKIETQKDEFLRIVETNISLSEFVKKLKQISPNLRYTNNNKTQNFNKIGFCAGSGSEFIQQAEDLGCNAFVTGDMKFHTAIDSNITVFDIGHFESEILIPKIFENLLKDNINILYAKECSPFLYA